MNRKTGFSLLELLTVTSIVLILAATLLVGGVYGRKLSMVKATETCVHMLSMATHTYASENNQEPPPAWITADGWPATHWPPQPIYNPGKCGIQALCSYIFQNPHTGDAYAEVKDFPSKSVRRAGGRVDNIRDAWEMPLFYFAPGAPSRNANAFDIFSAGPNRKTTCVAHGTTDYGYLQHGVIHMVKIKALPNQDAQGRLAAWVPIKVDLFKWEPIDRVDPANYPGIMSWDATKNKWIYATDKFAYGLGHTEEEEYPNPADYSYSYTSDKYMYPVISDVNDLDKDGIYGRTCVMSGSWTATRYKNDWVSTVNAGHDGRVFVAEMIPAAPDIIMNSIEAHFISPIHHEFGNEAANTSEAFKGGGSYRRARVKKPFYDLDDIGNW